MRHFSIALVFLNRIVLWKIKECLNPRRRSPSTCHFSILKPTIDQVKETLIYLDIAGLKDISVQNFELQVLQIVQNQFSVISFTHMFQLKRHRKVATYSQYIWFYMEQLKSIKLKLLPLIWKIVWHSIHIYYNLLKS